MKLSIVTINYNDAAGLKKTIDSVASQDLSSISSLHSNLSALISPFVIEHIVVDGGSTDGSVDVIKDYESRIAHHQLPISLKWVSEKDKGIYNAMNKGIEMALGKRTVDNSNLPTNHYIQILNSADVLAAPDVCVRMLTALMENNYPDMVYGNMIKRTLDGKIVGKSGQVPYSLLQYFTSTMNHDCCWIKRTLFIRDSVSDSQAEECYGLYDENLKIVSDWKWFLQAIGLGKVKPMYVDIDMTIFDTEGISEKNLQLRNEERRKVLEQVLPPAVLADYDKHAFDMRQMDRLRKHHLYPLVYFIERVLFKLEKWHLLQ